MKIVNYLSFDLEYWYDSEFVFEKSDNDLVLEGLRKVVKILDKNNVKATFFITGDVIKKYPKEIKELSNMGHEISSHGYTHKMINKMSKREVIKNLKKSREIIKRVTGKDPPGFRAPSASITKNEFWIYNELEKNGFRYSSSLFPVNMGLYGSSEYPTDKFIPTDSKIIEVPNKPFEILGERFPFSGGIYFRILPRQIIKFIMNKMNERGEKVNLYLHPWEFCTNIPKVKTNIFGKVTTYWGLKWNESKLDYILKNFKFSTFEDILGNGMRNRN